jgi:hypothetical protein
MRKITSSSVTAAIIGNGAGHLMTYQVYLPVVER